MKSKTLRFTTKVRAFPTSDDKNASKKLKQGDHNNDKCKTRIATWNLGSLTGRSFELAETLKRRKIDIACIQETKWKGNKAKIIGLGYKLFYNGVSSSQNGIGIILHENLVPRLISVNRTSDRLMSIKLAADEGPCINIISAYAPQVGCDTFTKQNFWEELENLLFSIPSEEVKLLCGDLNGHIGETNEAYETIHGGFGLGPRNAQGIDILDFAQALDMAIINSYFTKPKEHLITYKSANAATQIDYILCNRDCVKFFKDCKVIPGEAITTQHRLLVADFRVAWKKNTNTTNYSPKIKWHLLNTAKGRALTKDLHNFIASTVWDCLSANAMWNTFQNYCLAEAKHRLGVSKGPLKIQKETWWWNEEVQLKVQSKKQAFKTWQRAKNEDALSAYNIAKSEAKEAVAKAKERATNKLYDNLDSREGAKNIYKLAKSRNRKAQDITYAKYINDANGLMLTQDAEIRTRWQEYYSELSNVEFSRSETKSCNPTEGPFNEITTEEVYIALAKMKRNKALGPDLIPSEIFRALGEAGILWLTSLFNKVAAEGIPEVWRNSYLIPFYKNKGDVRCCSNYRGIKLMSHGLKIWERVLDARIRSIAKITDNQFGFVSGKSTVDAIHILRTVIEKCRLNKENLFGVFIDLEKAFDRVPRDLVWTALRNHRIPEAIIKHVIDTYHQVTTQVKCANGLTQSFDVNVGVHQGSALSPLLFNLVMDFLTREIQGNLPWTLLYADDVALLARDKSILQENLNRWVTVLESNGLRVSRTKTEAIEFHFATASCVSPALTINNTPLKIVDSFKYLGSHVSEDGTFVREIAHRIQCGWQSWRAASGVLCDKKIPQKLKGKIYKSMIRPVMTYASECWAVPRKLELKLHAAEMRMLRWASGVTLLDKIHNTFILGSNKVAPISTKLQENRLRWYGHVMRRPEDHAVKQVLQMRVGKRGPGRPPKTWKNTIENDMRCRNVSQETTQDRVTWRLRTRRADPK